MTPKTKTIMGWAALSLWCLTTLGCLSFFFSFGLGAALGPVDSGRLVLPLLLFILALAILFVAYFLLIRNSRRWVKVIFVLLLVAPHSVFAAYSAYIASLITAAPYFTTQTEKPIKLRLDLDSLKRPVFFFSEYNREHGLGYDPYRKHILKYPQAIFDLSEKGETVSGVIVIEYVYGRAARFWLARIETFPVETNRLSGTFLPEILSSIEDQQ